MSKGGHSASNSPSLPVPRLGISAVLNAAHAQTSPQATIAAAAASKSPRTVNSKATVGTLRPLDHQSEIRAPPSPAVVLPQDHHLAALRNGPAMPALPSSLPELNLPEITRAQFAGGNVSGVQQESTSLPEAPRRAVFEGGVVAGPKESVADVLPPRRAAFDGKIATSNLEDPLQATRSVSRRASFVGGSVASTASADNTPTISREPARRASFNAGMLQPESAPALPDVPPRRPSFVAGSSQSSDIALALLPDAPRRASFLAEKLPGGTPPVERAPLPDAPRRASFQFQGHNLSAESASLPAGLPEFPGRRASFQGSLLQPESAGLLPEPLRRRASFQSNDPLLAASSSNSMRIRSANSSQRASPTSTTRSLGKPPIHTASYSALPPAIPLPATSSADDEAAEAAAAAETQRIAARQAEIAAERAKKKAEREEAARQKQLAEEAAEEARQLAECDALLAASAERKRLATLAAASAESAARDQTAREQAEYIEAEIANLEQARVASIEARVKDATAAVAAASDALLRAQADEYARLAAEKAQAKQDLVDASKFVFRAEALPNAFVDLRMQLRVQFDVKLFEMSALQQTFAFASRKGSGNFSSSSSSSASPTNEPTWLRPYVEFLALRSNKSMVSRTVWQQLLDGEKEGATGPGGKKEGVVRIGDNVWLVADRIEPHHVRVTSAGVVEVECKDVLMKIEELCRNEYLRPILVRVMSRRPPTGTGAAAQASPASPRGSTGSRIFDEPSLYRRKCHGKL
jgi:hypothetical protein